MALMALIAFVRLRIASSTAVLSMAKLPAKEIELVPDAWPRFERFIKQVAKAGPQHKTSPAPKKAKKSKKNPSRWAGIFVSEGTMRSLRLRIVMAYARFF